MAEMNPLSKTQIRQKLKKLRNDLEELRSNRHQFPISITRLRTITCFCQDEKYLRQFALFIAAKSADRILKTSNQLPHVINIAREAMSRLSSYWKNPQNEMLEKIRESYFQLRDIQHQTRSGAWGTKISIIHNWEVYLIEACLWAYLNQSNAYQGYYLAKVYCERYDPLYGTGLIPDSVLYLEEIINFWEDCFEEELNP